MKNGKVMLSIWVDAPLRDYVRARAMEAKQPVSEWAGNALRQAVLNTSLGAFCFPRDDKALNDALSGEADAVSRAESAELGCEIAYRREPTQAEGDAHADGADECFVTMGGWTGRRCRACGRWVWGGPTACNRCVGREEGMYERSH